MAPPEKSAGAFRTIGELSAQTGLPQHVLRYWESRFPQLRPLQRAGKRRYYRPEDVALVLRIHALLDQQGYTILGVQKLLATERAEPAERAEGSEPRPSRPTRLRTLGDVRHSLRTALAADDNAARNGAATTI